MPTSNEEQEGPWRELALEHLSCFRDVILASTSHVDMWQDLKEFLVDEGTSESSRERAEAIFAYAWWCVTQSPSKWVAGQVETSFYEDLPAYCDLEVLVPLFVSPCQFEALDKAFRYRLTDDEYDAFRTQYYAATGMGHRPGQEGSDLAKR